MLDVSTSEEDRRPRILMFSQRNISPYDAWRSPHYEFEDIVCQLDSVELLAPLPGKWFNRRTRIARTVGIRSNIALNPGISKIRLSSEYDLLFLFCSFPRDLLNFRIEKSWKDHCKTSICMIDEIWVKQISRQSGYMRILSKFDYIVLYYSQSVKPVSEATGKKCYFLPPGIDAIKFCPYPDPPDRTIDVYSIGRRSEVTHKRLLEMAKENKIFYIYDTLSGGPGGLKAIDLKQHRDLFANLAKRSRFYIVNPGLVDCPSQRGNQIEIGNRYFDGAASGCIMIGEVPNNEVYGSLFNWPDAVISLPFGSDQIDTIINDLDKQPDREETMRRNNITQSLRLHDWAYRWEAILKIGGLVPLPNLLKRKEQLEKLAKIVEGKSVK